MEGVRPDHWDQLYLPLLSISGQQQIASSKSVETVDLSGGSPEGGAAAQER
jgi:hypothetical protein